MQVLQRGNFNNEDYGKGIIGLQEKNDVMTSHYVTITGVILDRESDNEWLRIQTWGEIYYLRLDEFYDYNQSLPYGTLILFA